MAQKMFMGSVGTAEAFRINEDTHQLELAFVSKTLTDSGLNISTTKDDIRAGQGAPIQFSFYHDPSVEITLTDVLWKRDYLTAQLGAKFEDDEDNRVDYLTKEVTFTNGVAADFTEDVLDLPMACFEGNKKAVWGAKQGSDDWKMLEYDETAQELRYTGANGKWCVRYLGKDDRAAAATISTQIIPEILFLVIKAPLFAGDSCAGSKGEAAGHVTFEIPRFQLNGAQEFSMNMSSNQTMSLSGIALASENATKCDSIGGSLLRVIEVVYNRNYLDGVTAIMSDEEFDKVGQTPAIYGIKENGQIVKVKNADLTFSAGYDRETDKYITAGPATVSITAKPTISTAVTVAS